MCTNRWWPIRLVTSCRRWPALAAAACKLGLTLAGRARPRRSSPPSHARRRQLVLCTCRRGQVHPAGVGHRALVAASPRTLALKCWFRNVNAAIPASRPMLPDRVVNRAAALSLAGVASSGCGISDRTLRVRRGFRDCRRRGGGRGLRGRGDAMRWRPGMPRETPLERRPAPRGGFEGKSGAAPGHRRHGAGGCHADAGRSTAGRGKQCARAGRIAPSCAVRCRNAQATACACSP